MLGYIWPLALVVISNVIYQICTKEVPDKMDPFSSLTVTYLVGAAMSFILSLALNKNGSFIKELTKLNWAPFVLGIVIVGLEAGYIYAYRAGWSVSTAQIVQASLLAVILIFVGFLIYRESLAWNKIAGIIICLIGLVFINIK